MVFICTVRCMVSIVNSIGFPQQATFLAHQQRMSLYLEWLWIRPTYKYRLGVAPGSNTQISFHGY